MSNLKKIYTLAEAEMFFKSNLTDLCILVSGNTEFICYSLNQAKRFFKEA
jgi:hypothetical protein